MVQVAPALSSALIWQTGRCRWFTARAQTATSITECARNRGPGGSRPRTPRWDGVGVAGCG